MNPLSVGDIKGFLKLWCVFYDAEKQQPGPAQCLCVVCASPYGLFSFCGTSSGLAGASAPWPLRTSWELFPSLLVHSLIGSFIHFGRPDLKIEKYSGRLLTHLISHSPGWALALDMPKIFDILGLSLVFYSPSSCRKGSRTWRPTTRCLTAAEFLLLESCQQ